MTITNALTIDVEDYYQVSNFEKDISREEWPSYECRVVESTRRIVRQLDRHNVKATFFILGYVADAHPDLVLEIDQAGHEIGSHSYWHRLVHTLTPREFRDDLLRSRAALEAIIQKPVTSFRAPSFSINESSPWALEILVEEGFTVDSSVMPTRSRKCPTAHKGIHPVNCRFNSGCLTEFPLAVHRLPGGVSVPISGGGYFRLFPLDLTSRLLRQVNTQQKTPFAFYIHPWEFDPDQPRLTAGTRAQRFRHYVNLSRTEKKFEKLLTSFRFDRMDKVLAGHMHRSDSDAPTHSLVA